MLEGQTNAFSFLWFCLCFSYFGGGNYRVFLFGVFGLCILDSLEHLLKSGPGRLSDSFGFKIVLKSYRGARKTTMEIKKIDLGRF